MRLAIISNLQVDKLTNIITEVKAHVPGGGHDVGSWCQSWRRWGLSGPSWERGPPAAAASVRSPVTEAHARLRIHMDSTFTFI